MDGGVGGLGRSTAQDGVLRRETGGYDGCGGMLDGIEVGVAAAVAVVDKVETEVEVMGGHCCGSRT